MRNPLLEKFTEPFGTVPFNEIKTEHFVPALDASIDEAKNSEFRSKVPLFHGND